MILRQNDKSTLINLCGPVRWYDDGGIDLLDDERTRDGTVVVQMTSAQNRTGEFPMVRKPYGAARKGLARIRDVCRKRNGG